MKALGSVHLSVTPSLILLKALIVTSKCHVPRLFGFKLSQTALFVQAAFRYPCQIPFLRQLLTCEGTMKVAEKMFV